MIIGLTGAAGAGKDTLADWLEVRHGFRRIALADPIREGLCAMFGLSMNVFKPVIKEQAIPWIGKSPRELMQTLGTEWGRDMVARDLWLRVASRKIAGPMPQRIVVTDIRFEDEAQWLRDHGGQPWRVLRNTPAAARDHISEAGIAHRADEWPIYNYGSIEDLFAAVDASLASLAVAAA